MIVMNTRTRPLFAAGLGLLMGLSIAACSSHPDATAADAQAPVAVTVATVTTTDVGETFETGGVVQARTTALLTARLVAPVQSVRVVPGNRVRAGQLLVVLDGRDLGAQARSAKAAALGAGLAATAAGAEQRAAEAALTLARATHDRIIRLHAARSATPQELDEATAQLQMAEARAAGSAARAEEARSGVERAQGASEAASTIESFTHITSPFDGVVTEKMVEPGNMASPGLPLLRVEDAGAFRLDVRVDASRVARLTHGTAVPVLLEGGTDETTTTVEGIVSEVGRAVDADSRTFIVKIALPNTPGLRSGMFGRARFGGVSRRALTLPPGAVVRRGQVTSVFVVDDGVARLRLVNMAGTEILAGIVEGETVVVNPPPDLADGRRVRDGGR
jgi:RND family efflux transporter MFP subunit